MESLRSLTAADLEIIMDIQRASPQAAQWSAQAWGAFIRGAARSDLGTGHCAWVMESGGRIAGFLAGMFSGEELEILNLAVAPCARRAGVASRLLARALAEAQRAGGVRAHLEVRFSNAPAIAFYERHGFEPCGRRKQYYDSPVEDALLLARVLTNEKSQG